ncbi:hypothetical protein JXA12_00460 [Candidatus Woesearchaeota archaeon]|nr:hypothetical protein [Candidatus Woesearchaeota archaeon]
MKRYALVSLVILIVALGGCQFLGIGGNESNATGNIILDDDDFIFLDENETRGDNETDEPDEPVSIDEDAVAYTVTVTEGDLVRLDLKAMDPDGDPLEYEFTEPLNAQGRWQTKIGDEGKYLVTVTVSDGKLSTSEDILIIVRRANRAPIIECPETITIKEGELLAIECNIYDEEGDSILVSYEGWTTSNIKQTTYDDAGEYTVQVRATDSSTMNTERIIVIVENVNREPVLEPIDDLTIMETTTVRIRPEASDPDGDELDISFSKPLDDDGEWQTTDGDAGTYEVAVVASDGTASTTETFTITVTQINTAPVLKPIADITVEEGDLIKLPINAYDPEGDELTVSFSGFMDAEEYQTTYDDAGEYEQTVTVSDGVLQTSETFTITIKDKNRPPVFVIPGE